MLFGAADDAMKANESGAAPAMVTPKAALPIVGSPFAPTTGGVVSFETPPGKIQLRLVVESATADTLDSELREVDVPDLTAAEAAFATPEVFRARSIPEFQRVKSDPKAMPTAAREFSRTERVFVRVQAYSSGTAAPTITARLLNRTGQPVGDLAVVDAPAGGESAHDIDLALTTLAPGEYVIEVKATGAATSTEMVGFRVTS